MADYSAYLPQTPPSSAYIGLSPEEQAQLAAYARPSASGRTHPMGGLALAGGQRYREGMDQYLNAVLQGNKWRQAQLQQVMRNNLAEAGINQMGRLGPELVRSGDTRLMAGSLFAQDQLPGLTDQQGGPSDASVEADTNARAIKEAQRQKALAESANQMQLAGYTPEVQALAQDYKLPLTKSSPTAVEVARIHAASAGRGSGRPLLMGTRQHYEYDKQGNAYLVTDRNYGMYGGGSGATSGSAPVSSTANPGAPTTGAASPSASNSGLPVPPGYTAVQEEDLSDDQASNAQSAIAEAQQAGYTPLGYLKAPDNSTILIVQGADGQPHQYDLDVAGGGSGAPNIDNAGNETGQ